MYNNISTRIKGQGGVDILVVLVHIPSIHCRLTLNGIEWHTICVKTVNVITQNV